MSGIQNLELERKQAQESVKFADQKIAPTTITNFSYMPFLDGLRALSIVLVMGFHKLGPVSAFLGTQLSGWAGVDLFFIISGFLISSILLREQDKTGTFSVKNFYARRWLRICPAYYVFLAVMFGFMLLRGQHDYAAFAIAGFYLTNLDMVAGWGMLPATTGLSHTWSLSVEEQFYLLWPATMKIAKGRTMALCLVAISAVYFWRLYLVSTGASWLRMSAGLDTKIDSILLGVVLALLWRMPTFTAALKTFCSKSYTQFAALAAVLLSLHFLGHPSIGEQAEQLNFWAFRMPFTLISMTTLLLTLIANPHSVLAKFLSTKPMVFVGKLSYSLYLWHVIVNFPDTHRIFENLAHHKKYVVEIYKFAACLSIASASYYLIEQPFLKLKSKFS